MPCKNIFLNHFQTAPSDFFLQSICKSPLCILNHLVFRYHIPIFAIFFKKLRAPKSAALKCISTLKHFWMTWQNIFMNYMLWIDHDAKSTRSATLPYTYLLIFHQPTAIICFRNIQMICFLYNCAYQNTVPRPIIVHHKLCLN